MYMLNLQRGGACSHTRYRPAYLLFQASVLRWVNIMQRVKVKCFPIDVHSSVHTHFFAASLENPRSSLAVLWLDTAHLRNSIFWQVDP